LLTTLSLPSPRPAYLVPLSVLLPAPFEAYSQPCSSRRPPPLPTQLQQCRSLRPTDPVLAINVPSLTFPHIHINPPTPHTLRGPYPCLPLSVFGFALPRGCRHGDRWMRSCGRVRRIVGSSQPQASVGVVAAAASGLVVCSCGVGCGC
jgi:hypothetical protein